MRVTVTYRDPAIAPQTVTDAAIGDPDWHRQVASQGVLDLVQPKLQRRRLVNLAGMKGIEFEYEQGDSEYDAAICGIELSDAQKKAANPSYARRTVGHYVSSGMLYSDWHP